MDSESNGVRDLMVGMAMKLITKRLGHLNPNMIHETVGVDNLSKMIYDAFLGGLRVGCEMSDRVDVYDDIYQAILASGRTEE